MNSRPSVDRKESEASAMALRQFIGRAACLEAAICLSSWTGVGTGSQAAQAQTAQQPSAQSAVVAKPVGTIKAISGNTITLTTDAGTDVTVFAQDATKV